jgi:hypothetical protein
MTEPTPADWRRFLAIIDMLTGTPIYDGLPYPEPAVMRGTSYARCRAAVEEMARDNKYENEILLVLSEVGGFTTGQIARKVSGGSNPRRDTQLVRQVLLRLESACLVKKMDDQKPVAWSRTEAGSSVARNLQP